MIIKVSAHNIIGWSVNSDINAIVALMEDVPHMPSATPLRDDTTSDLLL